MSGAGRPPAGTATSVSTAGCRCASGPELQWTGSLEGNAPQSLGRVPSARPITIQTYTIYTLIIIHATCDTGAYFLGRLCWFQPFLLPPKEVQVSNPKFQINTLSLF